MEVDGLKVMPITDRASEALLNFIEGTSSL